MENGQSLKNPLGVLPIPKLLLKYTIPSIISMVVSAIYNIVDQIFIGQGVGYLGNTATTVTFPLVTVGLALSLLIGNGSASFISLELGRGNSDKARRTLGNALTLLLVSGLTFSVVVLLFLRPILSALGATNAIMPYAVDYATYIMIGMPFNMIAVSISNIVRADGSPRYSMFSMLSGAVLNTILDPIFIFVFNMGVKGAAIATAISQMVSCVIVLVYVFRLGKYVRFSPENLRIDKALVTKVTVLGSFSFINHIAMTVMNVVMNNSFRYYGASSPYGSEIPLAAIGIVMKINGILISAILGVSIGAQPILGFNYGARAYKRVTQTLRMEVIVASILSTICCLLFILTPETFISLFGDSGSDFFNFSCRALSTYMCCVFIAGIQIPCTGYFQATGRPLKAMVLTLSRQVLFIIPLILLLPLLFGLEGILYAGPIGDICALAVTSYFILKELRDLGREIAQSAQGGAVAEG